MAQISNKKPSQSLYSTNGNDENDSNAEDDLDKQFNAISNNVFSDDEHQLVPDYDDYSDVEKQTIPVQEESYGTQINDVNQNDVTQASSQKSQKQIAEDLTKYDEKVKIIATNVCNHYKKIDKFRMEILDASTSVKSSFDEIEVNAEHLKCDPFADLFLHTICGNGGTNKLKLLEFIYSKDNDAQQSYETLTFEEIWSHRELFAHEFIAALLKFSEEGKALRRCPLSIVYKDNQSYTINHFTKNAPKSITLPTISSVISSSSISDRSCDFICSCCCKEKSNKFPTLFADFTFGSFERYWTSNHNSFLKNPSSKTLEHHFLFGDTVSDPECSTPFMEGKVGTNTFNVMHHLIHDCARLVFTWSLVDKHAKAYTPYFPPTFWDKQTIARYKLEENVYPDDLLKNGITLCETKKILKWKDFMYDLPDRSLITKYETLEECEKQLLQDHNNKVDKINWYLGKCRPHFVYNTPSGVSVSPVSYSLGSKHNPKEASSDEENTSKPCLALERVFPEYCVTKRGKEAKSGVSAKNADTKKVEHVSQKKAVSKSFPKVHLKNKEAKTDTGTRVTSNNNSSSSNLTNEQDRMARPQRFGERKTFDQYGPSSRRNPRYNTNHHHARSYDSYARRHNSNYERWTEPTNRNYYAQHSNRRFDNYYSEDERRRFDDHVRRSQVSPRKTYRDRSYKDEHQASSRSSRDRRKDSFSSTIPDSESSCSKRLKISDSSKSAEQDTSMVSSLKEAGKKESSRPQVIEVAKQRGPEFSVTEVHDNIKMLSFPDGSVKFLNVDSSSFIPDPYVSSHDTSSTTKMRSSSSSQNRKKQKGTKNSPPTRDDNPTKLGSVMACDQQLVQMTNMNGVYPKEIKTNIVDDDLGNLNKYNKRRDTPMLLHLMNTGIIKEANSFYEERVILKEISDDVTDKEAKVKDKLHFGQVSRAIGLNRNGVFLWKLNFGARSLLKAYERYEVVSILWNAVVTHEELQEILDRMKGDDPDIFVGIRNAPQKGDNENVHRPDFIDISCNNVEQSLLYLRSTTSPSPTTIIDSIHNSDDSLSCRNNQISLRSKCNSSEKDLSTLLEEVHHSVADSAYYAISNKNVCYGSNIITSYCKENDNTGHRTCVICGVIISSNADFGTINKSVGKHYPRNPLATNVCLDFIHICTKCVCDSVQGFKYFSRNAHLMQCLNATVMNSNFQWGQRQVCYLHSCWQKYFPNASKELKDDPAFQKLMESTVSFKTIDTTKMPWMITQQKKSKSCELMKCIEGAPFFSCHDFSHYTKKAISMPHDVDFGIVLLPESDFIFICNSSFKTIDSIHISLCETSTIKKLQSNGRSGAAGGIVSTETNSHSMTRNTKKDENLFVPSKKGVGISCVYKNDNNQVKSYSGVYNDVYMDRMAVSDKIRNVRENISYARISLAEMKSRTISLILASELGLLSDTEIIESFQFLQKKDKKWSKKGMGLVPRSPSSSLAIFTRFEKLLLHQVCTTGEMRNHQALHAHVDGNKSHFLESLALFGRLNEQDVYKENKLSDVIENMIGGYLFLPLAGIVLSIPCCTVSVHCKLKRTIHIPDLSRNIHNWSKVHGPSGSWVVDKSNDKRKRKQRWFNKAISALM